jgi:membrane protein
MRDDLERIGKRFFADIKRDDVSGLAAELAYRFLFAVFPFGIFVAALTAFIAPAIGIEDPTTRIMGAIGDNLPSQIAAGIRPQLEAVIGTTQPGLLTVGAVAALWAATGGTNALIKAMNRAYEVDETRPFLPKMALAIGLTVLASIGVLIAFVTIVGTSLLTSQVATQLNLDPGAVAALGLLRWPVVFVLLSLAVGVLYKLAPNYQASWRWSFVGGAIFSLGWIVATGLFGLYVANFANYSNTYGAIGGVIVLMLWFYLSSIILIGAAALVAATLKELQPATVAAGQEAAAESARGEVVGQAGESEADTTGAGRSIEAQVAGVTAASALARRERRNAPEPEPASTILVSGAVIAAGVAVGAAAARLLARDPR